MFCRFLPHQKFSLKTFQFSESESVQQNFRWFPDATRRGIGVGKWLRLLVWNNPPYKVFMTFLSGVNVWSLTFFLFFFVFTFSFQQFSHETQKIKMPCSKSLPTLVHVDDILFRKPVEIGSLLYFSSQVVYTQGHYVMVRVSAEVVQPEDGTHDLTNVFHFTLKTDSLAPEVIPRTYQGKNIIPYLFFFSLHFG